MAKFLNLQANVTISVMVENGSLTFFWGDTNKVIIDNADFTTSQQLALPPGQYPFQWRVDGQSGITRYSIRVMINGKIVPGTSIGPRVLDGGNNSNFGGGVINI